jgi:signal transduction histidine kinase
MSTVASTPFQAIERFLRIGPDLSAEERLRARVIVCTCLSYIILQTTNLTYLTIWQDGFQFKRPIALATCFAFAGALVLLRYTKSKNLYGTFFTVLALITVLVSATGSPAAKASMELGGGIHTPSLPILCVGAILATMVGCRLTAILYAGTSAALLIWLTRMSSAIATDPQLGIVGMMRAVQVGVGVFLMCVIGFTLSRLAYSALNKFESALERANRAEKTRKELLATMSHEIRTPLNGIIAVSDLLAKHKYDETTDTHLNIISLSAENLLEIVNESLGRAQSEHLGDLDALDISVRSESFSPREILQQTCDLFTAHAGQKGLWIGTHGLETLPETLRGDGPRLRQVMNNLIGNAIKFTQTGGVRLGARHLGQTDAGAVVQFFCSRHGRRY